jgi:hypothetical protein
MKKTIIAGIAACAIGLVSAQAQGTFNFNNYSQNGGAGSPVTIQGSGQYIGSDYMAGFFYMAGTVNDLNAFQAGATLSTAATPFFGATGGGPLVDGAGLFDGGEGVIPGAPGTYTIQVIAWTGGANYNTATIRGGSSLLQVVTVTQGGTTPNNNLTTLAPFTVAPVAVVPEPSTFALAGLGLASLVIFRRRK